MLIRPLTFENLEDRQLFSGASYDTAPSSTVPAAQAPTAVQAPAAVPAPVADEASSQPGSDSDSTDADADSYGSTPVSNEVGSRKPEVGNSSSAVAGSRADTTINPSPGSSSPGSSSPGRSSSSDAALSDGSSSDSTPGDSPSQYQSSNMAGMAEYVNQRPSYGSTDSYGSYSAYAYQQQAKQAAGAAQLLGVQTTAARRVQTDQPNPLVAHPADVPAAQAAAVPSAPQPAGRALHDEPGQGVESHAAAEPPRSGPADGEVRFTARLPIELRALFEASGHGEGTTESTAAVLSNRSPRVEPLLAGILPVDLPALKAGVERFFARLEELGDELADSNAWRLGAWSVTAAGAAAALEFARAKANDLGPRELLPLGGWRLPPPPRPKEHPA